MITEVGKVEKTDEQLIWVRTIQSSTCGSCQAKRGCGQHLLSRFVKSSRLIPLAKLANQNPNIGESVEIGIGENVVVLCSLIAYALPIICLVAAAAVAGSSGYSDFWSFCAALFGLALGALVSRLILRNFNPAWFNPVLIRVIEEPIATDRP